MVDREKDPTGWFLLLCLPSLWVLGCFIVGAKEGRYDIPMWALLALLPGFLFFCFVRTYENKIFNVSVWYLNAVCLVSMMVYFLVMMFELFSVFLLVQQFSHFDTIDSWYVSTLAIILFAFSIPGSVEEIGKFCICLLCFNKTIRQRRMDMILIAMTGAVVMASIENCEYLFKSGVPGQLSPFKTCIQVILRDLLAFPLHVSTGTLIGANMANVILQQKSLLTRSVHILLLPILIHGTYDSMLILASMEEQQDWKSVYVFLASICVFIAVLLAIRVFKKEMGNQEEKQRNTPPPSLDGSELLSV